VFSSAGTSDSDGWRRESLEGLAGAILLMPRKAEDMTPDADLEGNRSSDSESECRLKWLSGLACGWPDPPEVSA